MRKCENTLNSNKGITLIALVVTIVVLLILAGISISMLTGENGILQRAGEASKKTEKAQKEEQDILNSYEDQINEYAGIDWDTVLANATKHPDQKTSTAIGVGSDGKAVNMDLWEYNFDDVTNGYGLNDSASLTATASADASKGYTGTDFNNIVIPQYISIDDGENWTPVTNLDWLFYNCTELEHIDKMPDTVKSMRFTFRGCTNLNTVCELPRCLENMQSTFFQSGITQMPIIPQTVNNMCGTFSSCTSMSNVTDIPTSVKDLSYTFYGCSLLITPPVIPDGVTNLTNTFLNCSSLKYAPNIPDSVETMQSTFEGCTSLENATTIPSSVTNIIKVFYGCVNLRGELEINANVTGKKFVGADGYEREDYFRVLYNATGEGLTLKLSGSCNFLNEIIAQANNPRITLEN